ncbi:xanthine dehydrogenase 1-like [Aricia agestis]|uniref:xanthine dehydrogenase 1-like n=1 Tax=Aricia agestis TaxID=91739 RepID=UPI001C20B4C1|nr:xanthine dehydrogenase 1-like [Aricia agestis]
MDKISFTINGERHSLSGTEVSSSTSLNDYIRNYAGLFGTKAMCHEGGCGACTVTVSQVHPNTKERRVVAVNSCLVHVLSCHQWDITTVEGVGASHRDIQKRLAEFNGTQCGYCTPGWVMSMHSLYEGSEAKLTERQVERAFGGNMCRCTGYRPILDAFKSFAVDVVSSIQDVEDLHKMKCLKKVKDKEEDDWCVIDNTSESLLSLHLSASRWYKAYTVQDVYKILSREGMDSYRFIAGNTGKGVYPYKTEARVNIDISSVTILRDTYTDENLVLGAGMTISEVMATFQKIRKNNYDFHYLEQFYKHLELVATVPVRNIGTIGGNLALKNSHQEFPSDIFVLLATVEATVTIVDSALKFAEVKMQDFPKTDIKNKLIVNVKLPPLSMSHLIRTYKIMPRAQNAHAIVNAGFHFVLDSKKEVSSAVLVFGSINEHFIRAKETENILKGKKLFSDETLQIAMKTLQEELKPDDRPPEQSPACRKSIALGLFYKAILSLSPTVNPRYRSGGEDIVREISRGTQVYDTDKSVWPLNQPVPKLEALAQCSGEANYACDRVPSPRQVHLAFVTSSVCLGEIVDFDASEAMKLSGVVAFLTAKDIPGGNNFTPKDVPWQNYNEEILASKTISYYGQPVGVIAAVTHKLALKAAGLVKVKYKKSDKKPVLDVKSALNAPDKEKRIREDANVKATERGSDTTHVIKGTFSMGDQYHYTMETQSCMATHTTRGLKLRSATQWMDLVHVAAAHATGLPLHRLEVEVPRVGGGYGGKASRSAQIACACAVAAHTLKRDAVLVLPLSDNMEIVGKRQACYTEFEVGVNDDGVIQYLEVVYYSDCGCSYNDTAGLDIAGVMTNLYSSKRWTIKGYSVLTDKASNTWCRAPATTEATAIVEHIMERIAHATKKDSIDVRISNIAPENNAIKDIIDTLKIDSKFDERKAQIEKFNSENAWVKRSLKMSLMSFPISYSGNFAVTISVYHADGTILMSHGGIEMGQGINTKVAQVCAYILNVPLEMITVRGSDSFTSPNAMASNGSITSESVAFATVKACKELLERLEPAKAELYEPKWIDVIKKAYDKGINLQVNAMTSSLDHLVGYSIYGACVAEVELHALEGTTQLLRVDLVQDTGRSMSPALDVGQIEGAFIMGLGLWTSERLVYDPSGKLLTNNTWTYKPPGANDIPVDFRVYFRRNESANVGVLRSKATGEPALVLSVVVAFAIHGAITEIRKEFGYNDIDWVPLDTPCTVEHIMKAISPNVESYKLK